MQASKPAALRTLTTQRALLLAVLVFGIALRLWAANTEDHQSPDTFTYARQTAAFLSDGVSAFRTEAARFLSDPSMAGVPPISRTVWILTLAGWSKLTNITGPNLVVSFACFADILSLLLLAFLASETFGITYATLATLLYAVSPAALAVARHGWGDSFTGLLCVLELLLVLRCFMQRAFRWPLILLGVVGGLTFAVKETAFLVSMLAVCITAGVLFVRQQKPRAVLLLATFTIAFAVTLAWNSYALGGLSNVVRLTGAGRDPNGLITYAATYQNGSPLQWFGALFLFDPLLLTLGIAGIVVLLLKLRRTAAEHTVLLVAGAICVVLTMLPMLSRNLYNARWLASALAPACLLAAFAFQSVLCKVGSNKRDTTPRWLPMAACALLICVVSLWRYNTLIARPDLQDLSLKMLLTAHN